MRALRVITLLLLIGIAAGPTLLDRCLFSCHDESPGKAAVPSCHEEAAAADGLSVHGVAACGHDHESLLADSTTEGRVSATRHLVLAFASSPVVLLEPPHCVRRQTPQAIDSSPRPHTPLIVPLRV